MEDDIRTGWRVVLETHTGHQVNEEGVALLPEPGVLVDKDTAQETLKQKSKCPAQLDYRETRMLSRDSLTEQRRRERSGSHC